MAKPLRLEAMAQFLTFLSSMPDTERVCPALVRGPLSVFGARAGAIMLCYQQSELRMISHFGHTEQEMSRFGRISLEIDVPIVRSFRECAIQHFPAADVPDAFPVIALDAELWATKIDRLGATAVISAPITYDGAAIGAYGFHVDETLSWADVDIAYLNVISAVLGLWLAHPGNGLRDAAGLNTGAVDAPLALTARQLDILRLIAEDLPNERIAARLGYSRSTIKNEILMINKVLRTTDRRAAVERARELNFLD